MRNEYPPDGYIDGRFAATTRIDVNAARIRSQTSRTAVVAVDLTEYRLIRTDTALGGQLGHGPDDVRLADGRRHF